MKDFYLATLIGFGVGVLVLLPLANIGFIFTPLLVLGIILGFTVLGPLAFGFFHWLASFRPIFDQIGKFSAIGTLNSLLDLGVVNIFIMLTGVAGGWLFSFFKAISFLLAATNSYFWNKFWTFQSRTPATWREYVFFAIFTILSVFINVTTASLVVNFMAIPPGISLKLWANIGALAATAVSLAFNFFLYKTVVFERK